MKSSNVPAKPSDIPVITIHLNKGRRASSYLMPLLSLIIGMMAFSLYFVVWPGPAKYLLLLIWITAGIYTLYTARKSCRIWRNRHAGMVISQQGIESVSWGNSLGIVPWTDIEGIRVECDREHEEGKYIVIDVNNPQQYIAKEHSDSGKRKLSRSYHYYGSPLCISDKYLDCSFEQLHDIVMDYYDDYLTRELWRTFEELTEEWPYENYMTLKLDRRYEA